MRDKLVYVAVSLVAVLLLYTALPWRLQPDVPVVTQPVVEDFSGSVSAASAVLIEAESGRIIWEKNAHQQRPMASTTKIMTALLTLSQPDLDEVFTVSSKAIAVEGTSMGLQKGDKVSLYALAVGMLTVSGNDGANAAAVRIAGSVKKFAARMNQKAEDLGMENTNFVTPSGLDAEGHYSTAYDMALLGAAAIRNQTFLDICSARATAADYGNPAYTRVLTNSNRLLRNYEGCIGIKTGYTSKAGRCLVSAVKRDGVTLVCVTLNAPDDWNDHQKLYDYGFTALETVRVLPDAVQYGVDVAGTGQQVTLLPQGEVSVTVLRGEKDFVTQRVVQPQFVFAPVRQGDPVGCIEYIYNGRVVAQQSLVAAYDVTQPQQKSFWEKIIGFFGG